MRRNLTLATAFGFALLAAACGGGGDGESSLGPVPTSQPTGNSTPTTAPASVPATATGSETPLPSATPTAIPNGSVTQGSASLVVSGDLQTSQPSLPLVSPAVYTPPPGSFALTWQLAGAGFALAGRTFVGTQSTSDHMRLAFFVHASSGTYRFTSVDGGCSVTVVEPPHATSFSGTFTCGSIVDDGGAITVTAQGAFLATG